MIFTGSTWWGALCDGAQWRSAQYFQEGGGKDESRAAEAAELVFVWQKEAMAVHGFAWAPTAEGGPAGSWPTNQ